MSSKLRSLASFINASMILPRGSAGFASSSPCSPCISPGFPFQLRRCRARNQASARRPAGTSTRRTTFPSAAEPKRRGRPSQANMTPIPNPCQLPARANSFRFEPFQRIADASHAFQDEVVGNGGSPGRGAGGTVRSGVASRQPPALAVLVLSEPVLSLFMRLRRIFRAIGARAVAPSNRAPGRTGRRYGGSQRATDRAAQPFGGDYLVDKREARYMVLS